MANSRINVPFSVGTEAEAKIGKEGSEVSIEGRFTFTEKNLYLGLGNGEYYKYDGTDTEGMPIVNAQITSEAEAIVLAKEKGKDILFFNSGIPSITQIQANGDVITTSLFGEAVTQEQLSAMKTSITNEYTAALAVKPNRSEVYTKEESLELLDRASKIETSLQKEVTRATTRENEIEIAMNAKAKVIIYSTGISLTPPDFVVHGQTIYLVKEAFTTTGNFTTDEAHLVKAAPDIVLNISSYKANDQHEVGDMMIYQGKLYTCKTACTLTGTWDTDKANFDDGVIFFSIEDYYTKETVNSLLAQKQGLLEAGSGVSVAHNEATGKAKVSADMTIDATASKIVQRDASGIAYANNKDNPDNTELINAKTLAKTKQDLDSRINEVENKFIGTAEESFSITGTFVAPENMGTQTFPCKLINIKPTYVAIACQVENWNQLLQVKIQTTDDKGNATLTATWLDNPSKNLDKFTSITEGTTTYKALKVTLSKGGNKLADVYFNEPNATNQKATTSDYSGSRYKVYTVVIDMGKAKTQPAPKFSEGANTFKYPYKNYTNLVKSGGCCYLEDDAVGKDYTEIMNFIGATPVALFNGKIDEYIDPNDYSKKTDGSASSYKTIGRDIMVMFPKRGLRFKTEGSLHKISITDQENAEGFTYNAFNRSGTIKDRFYYGAYEGYVDSKMLYSVSCRIPRVKTTLTEFRAFARARNNEKQGITGYQLPSYYMIMYLQACYLLVHQSLNGQATVGSGRNSTNVLTTGGADTWGMNMENLDNNATERTSGKTNMKCLGIEDFWANCWDWVDGFWVDQFYNVCLSTDPDNYNDYGHGYISTQQRIATSGNSGSVGYVSGIQCTNETGFWPSKVEYGSDSEYFCDYFWQNTSRCLLFGGDWDGGLRSGPFCFHADAAASSSSADVSSRLAFL